MHLVRRSKTIVMLLLAFRFLQLCQIHKTLRVTPAMEAKLAKKPMTIQDIVSLIPVETRLKEVNTNHVKTF